MLGRRGGAMRGAWLALMLVGCSGGGDAECAPGRRDCPCASGELCDDGLVCDVTQGICVGTRTASLPAIDPAARSCEVLLEDDGAQVAGADFGGGVRGETIRQAPRTAVTFFSLRDAPIEAAAIRIELIGAGDMRVARARCFDRLGHALPNGGIATDG